MKKYTGALIALTMSAGLITFIACSKDAINEIASNQSALLTKGGSTLDQLQNIMVAYYAASGTALAACQAVDKLIDEKKPDTTKPTNGGN